MSATPERPDESDADDPRLLRAAQEYLAALESGGKPDPGAFAARFPELARDLRPYLEALDLFHAAAPPASGRPTPEEPLAVEALGDFRIVREIGRGGMGVVYEAVQRSLGRRVALKVLPFAAALDAKQLRRFQNEAQAAAQLHHTNIVPVYFVGCERGVHYYAMQLIEGQNLADLIRQLRPRRPDATTHDPEPSAAPSAAPPAVTAAAARLSTLYASRSPDFYRTLARLVAQAAEALEHAHQLGVIHRDIKPANLLVDAGGTVWVTDFGLAQFRTGAGLTRTGDLLGTLRYMSPEQAAGQGAALDARTDVYSLGATLYELLTLEPLFDGQDQQRLLRQILNDEPRPPRAVDRSVPPELETIVLKAVSKSPADRYATARDFADDLHRFLDHRPIRARRPTVVQRARKWARRHPAVVGAAVVVLVVLLAGAVVFSARERRRAEEAEEQYRLARRSVDEMVRISEEELADKPHLEGVRRRLLEAALDYYSESLEKHRDNPRDQQDLAEEKEKVKKLLDDLAQLEGAWQLFLLQNPAVLDDLSLSEGQRQKVGELSRRLGERGLEWFGDFRKLSEQERQSRFLELARRANADLHDLLTPGQRERLGQIALQSQGLRAFNDADVAAKLKLTAPQRERIRALEADTFLGGFGHHHGDDCPPDEPRKGPGDKMRAAREQVVSEVLTPEQARRWQEMTGKPFQGPLKPFGPPPGLFGPPGPHGRGDGPPSPRDRGMLP